MEIKKFLFIILSSDKYFGSIYSLNTFTLSIFDVSRLQTVFFGALTRYDLEKTLFLEHSEQHKIVGQ